MSIGFKTQTGSASRRRTANTARRDSCLTRQRPPVSYSSVTATIASSLAMVRCSRSAEEAGRRREICLGSLSSICNATRRKKRVHSAHSAPRPIFRLLVAVIQLGEGVSCSETSIYMVSNMGAVRRGSRPTDWGRKPPLIIGLPGAGKETHSYSCM